MQLLLDPALTSATSLATAWTGKTPYMYWWARCLDAAWKRSRRSIALILLGEEFCHWDRPSYCTFRPSTKATGPWYLWRATKIKCKVATIRVPPKRTEAQLKPAAVTGS
jgi:hypothetical protein